MDDDDDDDDAASRDSFSTAGSDELRTSPHQQGYNIGANLRGLMEKRISFSKTNSFTRVQPTHRGVLPTGADPQQVLTLADMQRRVQREGSSADNSLVNPDDSVSMVQSAARTRHSNLPDGTRALDSLSAYEVALLLHSLELGRYAEGFMSLPIRGADLETATDEDLQEAGMSIALHRRALLTQVLDMRSEGVPTHLLESALQDALTLTLTVTLTLTLTVPLTLTLILTLTLTLTLT